MLLATVFPHASAFDRRRAVLATVFAAPLPDVIEEWRSRARGGTRLQWSGMDDTNAGAPGLVAKAKNGAERHRLTICAARGDRLFGSTTRRPRQWRRRGRVPARRRASTGRFRSGTLRVQFNNRRQVDQHCRGASFWLRPSGHYHYIRYNTRGWQLAVWGICQRGRRLLKHGEVHSRSR